MNKDCPGSEALYWQARRILARAWNICLATLGHVLAIVYVAVTIGRYEPTSPPPKSAPDSCRLYDDEQQKSLLD